MEGTINGKRAAAAVGMSLVLATAAVQPMSGLITSSSFDTGSCIATAQAQEIKTGLWMHSSDRNDSTLSKLARKVDSALAAQHPRPTYKKQTNKKNKTITVTVSVHTKKAGMGKARNTKRKVYGSLVAKVRASTLYRAPFSGRTVSDDWAVYGVNNYGTDNMTDTSMRVGRAGTADIDVSFVGCLWKYQGSFTRANRVSEVYWNRTVRSKVCSVPIPKGYRLILKARDV
ncbi:MAG: hypothetical protein ACOX69_08310 [Coriobacteriales bacterium]|jgi:hypothetical protein